MLDASGKVTLNGTEVVRPALAGLQRSRGVPHHGPRGIHPGSHAGTSTGGVTQM